MNEREIWNFLIALFIFYGVIKVVKYTTAVVPDTDPADLLVKRSMEQRITRLEELVTKLAETRDER